jgi:maleate isomerase
MDPVVTGRFIGQLVPSSNRTVERTTERLLADYPGLASCYSRIPYRPDGGGQPEVGYDMPPVMAAAELLTHATVEAICWNGTKGAADGFEVDRVLCAAATASLGVPVTSVSLDILAILQRLGARRIAIISQGTPARTRHIGDRFGEQGFATVAVRAFGLGSNLEAAMVAPATLAHAVRGCVAEASPDAVLIWGTNMPGLPVVAALEAECSVAVIDSCSIGIWGCLAALGLPAATLAKHGKIFGLL